MNIFESWEYKWFGIWREGPDDPVGFPEFATLVDNEWRPKDKNRILDYLKNAPVVVTSFMPPVKCRLCGDDLGDPGRWQSDGVWLWHHTLAHFAERHSVRLPDEMVRHMRNQGYALPTRIDVDPQTFPWPKIPLQARS